MTIICNFVRDEGRFLLWHWKLWKVGGGAGVNWYFLGHEIYIGRFNPLWIVFKIQRRKNER